MKKYQKYCAIVDAYSTGNQLAAHLKKYGFEVIHIQSSPDIPTILHSSFRPEDFKLNIIHIGNLNETAKSIANFQPEFIIVGAETGVELADKLSSQLNLIRNSDELIEARRDKYLMVEAVKNCGIRTVDHLKSSDCNQIIDWACQLNKWPIVVKPVNSAASDGVTFCYTEDQIRTAFQNIHGKLNQLGLENTEVLAQTFIEGQQYIVNAVSYEGKHYISDIWKEDFFLVTSKSVIYDQWILIKSIGEVQQQLISYVSDVLTALGIKYGASHTEVKITKEGPVLIETGARTMGLSFDENTVENALGYSHASLTVESYANSEKFLSRINQNYLINKHLSAVFLVSNQEGIIKNMDGFNKIKELESYTFSQISKRAGDLISKTREPKDHPGFIFLQSEEPSSIERDYSKIRELEKVQALFSVEQVQSKLTI